MREEAPVDTFELLGEEARLSILRALLEERRTSADPHVRFTDLRDRAGIEDTGRFNYHLGKLRGTFVERDDDDDGYKLSAFGHRMLAPLVTGMFDPEATAEPVETPGECPQCGAGLRVQPSDAKLRVVCVDGHTVNYGLLGNPRIVADREPGAAVRALGLLNVQGIERATEGVCPVCHGPVDGTITGPEEEAAGGYVFRAPCPACGNQFAASVGDCVGTHPAVVSFLDDHGVDARRAVPWAQEFRRAGTETVLSEDPLELRVDVEADGERLAVVVDESGTVVSTEREAVADT